MPESSKEGLESNVAGFKLGKITEANNPDAVIDREQRAEDCCQIKKGDKLLDSLVKNFESLKFFADLEVNL
ncbi:MAG: hypothetical protein A2Y25_01420 [Candidatus Melainabacteria bacterium GWF2_37_15]|nr:MAG: hypothetical protein A2Y25_01420 [Candidatus Melainabacteria bacterium GWF2_37_15]